MKVVFTGSFEDLKLKLSELCGEWDDSQPNKKVLRVNSGVMNWFETTGTLQFQGKEESKIDLEGGVKALLYPSEYSTPEPKVQAPKNEEPEITASDAPSQNAPNQYLDGSFEDSEIIIGIVSAVGTEVTRVITPLKDRLKRSVRDTATYWTLTPYGDLQMVQLRALRRSEYRQRDLGGQAEVTTEDDEEI